MSAVRVSGLLRPLSDSDTYPVVDVDVSARGFARVVDSPTDVPPSMRSTSLMVLVRSTGELLRWDGAAFISVGVVTSGIETIPKGPGSLSGNAGKLVRVNAGATALEFVSGTAHTHVWNEAVSGTTDGVNTTFTLAQTPNPPESLMLFRNGILQRAGVGNDFVLSGATLTMAVPPSANTILIASYVA